MKRRNPRYGRPRIARQASKAFGIEIDKDVVRRVLAQHDGPRPGGGGPSWLAFIGHAKECLWSVDPFRCDSSPFVERLIGNLRRELLDQVLFWNAPWLVFTPPLTHPAAPHNFTREKHCGGPFELPVAA